MKKPALLLAVFSLLFFQLAASPSSYGACDDEMADEAKAIYVQARNRGYVTEQELDYLNTLYLSCYDDNVHIRIVARSCMVSLYGQGFFPFRPMFYLALEEENYEEAERIRRKWVSSLRLVVKGLEKVGGIYSKNAPGCEDMSRQERLGNPKCNVRPKYLNQAREEISKLDIVGLADPMLNSLRKDLKVALTNKDWDNATKIQNLINMRVNELKATAPSETTLAYNRSFEGGDSGGSGGNVNITVQGAPSKQRIEVQNVPRYGVSDVARAMDVLAGKNMNVTEREKGTLKLMDIFLGR